MAAFVVADVLAVASSGVFVEAAAMRSSTCGRRSDSCRSSPTRLKKVYRLPTG